MQPNKSSTHDAVSETILRCPNCDHSIPLTESLAAPILERTRRRYEALIAEKDAEVSLKADALRQERDQVAKVRLGLDEEIARRLSKERGLLVATETRKAREAAAAEISAKEADANELRAALAANDAKLAEAQRL